MKRGSRYDWLLTTQFKKERNKFMTCKVIELIYTQRIFRGKIPQALLYRTSIGRYNKTQRYHHWIQPQRPIPRRNTKLEMLCHM
jgi:hypothetical protein